MKVFLSWSGELSQAVAETLRGWLPCVIQSLQPYVSSQDIHKGERWATDIAEELESSQFGILCVTPDNLQAPWLHFEAGALSKAVDRSRVCPLLCFGVKNSDLEGPMVQFQSAAITESDVEKMMTSLNNALTTPLETEVLQASFKIWWPELEKRLVSVQDKHSQQTPKSPRLMNQARRDEIMEEMLELIRRSYGVLRSPEELLPSEYLQTIILELPDMSYVLARDKIIRSSSSGKYHTLGKSQLRYMLKGPQAIQFMRFIMDFNTTGIGGDFKEKYPELCDSLDNPLIVVLETLVDGRVFGWRGALSKVGLTQDQIDSITLVEVTQSKLKWRGATSGEIVI